MAEIVRHCVPSILINWKLGKQERYFQSIVKGDNTPHAMSHVDLQRPMTTTSKGH